MVIAPIAGCIKSARPDTGAALASPGFLGPVAARGNGQSLCHHDATQVTAIHNAGGQQAIILIGVLGTALHGANGQQFGEPVACDTPAGPGPTIRPVTLLSQLRSVQSKQADTRIAQPEAVAVAGARPAGYRGRRLIQQRSEQPCRGQNDNCQHGAARAAKERKAMQLPPPDFTAR
jgi:hypothetical protein